MTIKKYLKKLVLIAVLYSCCIWWLRDMHLTPISAAAGKEGVVSFQMCVSFKAILLLFMVALLTGVGIASLLEFMCLREGVVWYLVFATISTALSVPGDIRRSRYMEWVLTDATELQTTATVLTVALVVLLLASAVTFVVQIVTEKYRERNMVDEVLTIILSLYYLRMITGQYNGWYMIAAVSTLALGMVGMVVYDYICKMKSKLDEVEKKCFHY